MTQNVYQPAAAVRRETPEPGIERFAPLVAWVIAMTGLAVLWLVPRWIPAVAAVIGTEATVYSVAAVIAAGVAWGCWSIACDVWRVLCRVVKSAFGSSRSEHLPHQTIPDSTIPTVQRP